MRRPARLLVVDDEAASAELVRAIFEAEGFEVSTAQSGEAALAAVADRSPDVVVLDMRLPDIDGLEVLRRLRAAHPQVPVVMLTAYGEVSFAVEAIRQGAYHFMTKPVDADEITVTVSRALERNDLLAELQALRERLGERSCTARLLGASAAAQELMREIRKVGPSEFTVLIEGETGTGKELVARAVHEGSRRHAGPLIAIDCGAVPEHLIESELFGYERGAFTGAEKRREGHFQLAAGGSVFLDEIGNLPPAIQQKLLRVIQEREILPLGASQPRSIDVRFVAASNASLEEEVRAGRFRQDLYFRLAEFTIRVPPLRERRADVPALSRLFLEEVCLELRRPPASLAGDAIEMLQGYDWPGNVRELRNVVRRAVLLCTGTTVSGHALRSLLAPAGDAPAAGAAVGAAASGPRADAGSGGGSLKDIVQVAAREREREVILESLRQHGGNKTQAARALRVDYKAFLRKVRLHGLDAVDLPSDAAAH